MHRCPTAQHMLQMLPLQQRHKQRQVRRDA